MGHKHSVYDSDTHFSINPITRGIRNDSSRKTVLIQGDHNSERFTFDLPRYIEGHDMSVCDVVEVHYLNIASDKKDQLSGVYTVEDLQVSPDDDQVVVCSWLISQNATGLVGSLNFLLRFRCVENDLTTYVWNTAVNSTINVSDSINGGETLETDYLDIIEQWKASVIREITDDVNANVSEWAETESGKIRGLVLEETTKTNTALAVERARIDLMQSGAAADDAELIDIRVGADGVTYNSAGTAVREQITDNIGQIENLQNCVIWKSPNVFNPATVIKDKTIDINTGEIIDDSTGAMISEYIRIPPGETRIMTSYVTGSGVHQHQHLFVGYYDVNKEFILYQENASDYTIPNGAKWLIICIGAVFATAYPRLMLEFGTIMSEFSEYGKVKLLDDVETPRISQEIAAIETKINNIGQFPLLDLLFGGTAKIKLLGDSITHGVGGTGFAQDGNLVLDAGDTQWYENTSGICWANMLRDYLSEKFPTCTVCNYGTKSESYYSMINTTVDKLDQLIEDDDDLIIMMLGTNDRDHSKEISVMVEYACQVIEYVTIERSKRLIIMTSLPAGITNDGTKAFHMEDVDMVNSYVAKKYNLKHISVYQEFRKYLSMVGEDIDDYLLDGLHPNDVGYAMMFEIICNGLGIATKPKNATW